MLLVLVVVVLFVSAPLRRPRPAQSGRRSDDGALPNGSTVSTVAELEAARDAKYREIRDAELDHGTGKLSDHDYELIDGTLRAEAVEILRRLDGARDRVAAGERHSASGGGLGHAPEMPEE